MIYLVVLRLKSRRNNQFDTELEKQGDDITELFPDCWLLASDKTARGIFESLRSVIDLKDRLLIVDVDLKNHSVGWCIRRGSGSSDSKRSRYRKHRRDSCELTMSRIEFYRRRESLS
jgi:hypothetical protein